MAGAVNGGVDGGVLLAGSPVLTAVLESSDVVCAPVDVEDDPDGESVEAAVDALGESPVLTAELEASDFVCAPVDVEDDPDGESVEAAVDELDEVPDEESDDEFDGSARASPCPESTATPTPSVMITPANRTMSRTAFLTRTIGTITTSAAKENASSSQPATFGDVPFTDLRPSHVRAWMKAMQDKPLEPGTIRTRFTNVRGVIRAALQTDCCPKM